VLWVSQGPRRVDDDEEVSLKEEPMDTREAIARHYSVGPDLDRRIDEVLGAAGLNEAKSASPGILAALDQFHVGGIGATADLGRLLAPKAGARVLDVGSGLGGPSRYLAAHYGCRVTGVDLSESYCRVASLLARHTGLEDRVEYRQADALRLPFPGESFDAVWTQHVSMNVSEKETFYEGIARVLKRTGRFALHDVVGSGGEAIRFPVPWARDASSSYLVCGDDLRKTILHAGFSLVTWNDVSVAALDWLGGVIARTRASGPPILGLDLLLGPAFPEMLANFHGNIEEHRCVVVQAVFERIG
jgi:SAM-dependent methyltransferase